MSFSVRPCGLQRKKTSVLAIFNTIGQLVGGLCRDHTIAKGLSLKFATSGGLELEAQWAGRQSEGLVTAFALH